MYPISASVSRSSRDRGRMSNDGALDSAGRDSLAAVPLGGLWVGSVILKVAVLASFRRPSRRRAWGDGLAKGVLRRWFEHGGAGGRVRPPHAGQRALLHSGAARWRRVRPRRRPDRGRGSPPRRGPTTRARARSGSGRGRPPPRRRPRTPHDALGRARRRAREGLHGRWRTRWVAWA